MNACRFATLAALLLAGGLTSGCAVLDAMEAQTAKHNARTIASFPDQQLALAYLTPDGRPNGSYPCGAGDCRMQPRDDNARVDYILIEPNVMTRHHDHASIPIDLAREPIENTPIGQIFIRNARSRGNFVAAYGAPVNEAIIRFTNIPISTLGGHSYPANLASCLIEIDGNGGFVSILATRHDVSWGVIRTDLPTSKDLFAEQMVFLFPNSTARLVQERIGSGFRENYRVR